MIRIIIDSSADYLKEEIEKKQMTLVPLNINLDDTLYMDGVDITRDQLYEWLMESNGFPKTAQLGEYDTFSQIHKELRAYAILKYLRKCS